MNTFAFIGALGRDAETKALPSGQSVTNFNVANNIGYKDSAKTLWVSCALFGKRGEALSPYLKKGQKVFVSGELSTREYTGRDGVNRTALELTVQAIELDGKPPSREPGSDDDKGEADNFDDFDDDIPFL